jgi:DNA-binding SARP family transcriptional activator
VLRVEPGELDLGRFDRLLEQGREELARGEASAAAATLAAALELWRGPALADVLYERFAGAEAERLEERRLLALEERIDADLALGGGSELAAELEALVREHPFRERLLGQLMLALYRSGRQAEALAAFQAGRRRLAEEIGLEPAPELAELQRKILDQHASLGAPKVKLRIAQRVSRHGRAPLVAAGAAAVAVAASEVIGTEREGRAESSGKPCNGHRSSVL